MCVKVRERMFFFMSTFFYDHYFTAFGTFFKVSLRCSDDVCCLIKHFGYRKECHGGYHKTHVQLIFFFFFLVGVGGTCFVLFCFQISVK